MQMAASEVEMASRQTFCCLRRDRSRGERSIRDKNNNSSNNVRTVQTMFEKNLKVFVRDHLNDKNCSITGEDSKGNNIEAPLPSPVSDRKQTGESEILPHTSSNPQASVSDPNQLSNPGQPENQTSKENLGASSLVQIWEARLQHQNSDQTQAQSDISTTSGLNQTENCDSLSDPLNNETDSEPDATLPVDGGNNKKDEDYCSQSGKSFVLVSGEKEREGVRVLEIVRKLSNDPETINDGRNNGNYDNNGTNVKEVALSARIIGRKAYAALLAHVMRDRQKELAWLLERNTVSKCSYRGRLQSLLKTRCFERCVAIQDRRRSKSAASDVTRSPRGLVLTNLRYKFKTDSENSGVARSASCSVFPRVSEGIQYPEASRFKVCLAEDAMEATEKNVLKGTTGKDESRERQGTDSVLEAAKKAENRIKSAVEASRTKACLTENAMNLKAAQASHLPPKETADKHVLHETKERSNERERREVTKKAVLSETTKSKTASKKPPEKTIHQHTVEEKSKPQEKSDKATSKETAEENNSMRIADKVNLWSSKVKTSRRSTEKTGPKKNTDTESKTEGKAIPLITEKSAVTLQEAERRTVDVEAVEKCITSRETVERIRMQETTGRVRNSAEAKTCDSVETERFKKEEENYAEAESRETANRKNAQEVAQNICLQKPVKEASQGKEEEETTKHVSGGRTTEENGLHDGEEVSVSRDSGGENGVREVEDKGNKNQESAEKGESHEAKESADSWDESGTAEAEDEEAGEREGVDDEEEQHEKYELCSVESSRDWIKDISRPRSYWEDLRKQWYLEALSPDSPKPDIRRLIERRTVSDFLSSGLSEKIERFMISRLQQRWDAERKPRKEAFSEQCTIQRSENHQNIEEQRREESETEQEQDKTVVEEPETDKRCHESASDDLSQSSGRSTMMSWSFRDQDVSDDLEEPVMSQCLHASSPSDRSRRSSSQSQTNHETSSPEMQMICDLKTQMDQLQREMLELRNSIKSSIDMQLQFQKSFNRDSSYAADQQGDATDQIKRKCCVCNEMPVDTLLYRCGHMCTCLKCAHELQWNSKKCPICMASIVDVVRVFLNS